MNNDANGYKPIPRGATGGWKKLGNVPVVGGALGPVFDCSVLKIENAYKMWFSWRSAKLIGYCTSEDGISWTLPKVALTAEEKSAWEGFEVSRPTVLLKDGVYHMWYTGQNIPSKSDGESSIGYASSKDGINWTRREGGPVLKPDQSWENSTACSPHVIWDEGKFKMWYSGGGILEAEAIGYATSEDGIHWMKEQKNPIFKADPGEFWEMYKVGSSFVFKEDGWYNMLYMGYDADVMPSLGLARSRDGITGWQRHVDNPVIAGTEGIWDFGGIRKASLVKEENGYKLWYTGRNRKLTEIGAAFHSGFDLSFPQPGETRTPERGVRPYNAVLNPVEGVKRFT